MSNKVSIAAATAVAFGLLSGPASASLTTFFKANTTANPDGLPGQTFVVDTDVKNTITSFKSPLISLSNYEFEDKNDRFAATTGSGGPMIVSGAQRVCGTVTNENLPCPGSSYQGRFNTTGLLSSTTTTDGSWLETTSPNTAASTTSFSMAFGTAINALGFFGTDFYDFGGTVSYKIFDAQGNEVEIDPLGGGHSIPIASSTVNGSLLFYGLQSTTAFSKITFTMVQPASNDPDFVADILGFDSVITGLLGSTPPPPPPPPPGLPEPGSIALTGFALVALGLARRNRKKV